MQHISNKVVVDHGTIDKQFVLSNASPINTNNPNISRTTARMPKPASPMCSPLLMAVTWMMTCFSVVSFSSLFVAFVARRWSFARVAGTSSYCTVLVVSSIALHTRLSATQGQQSARPGSVLIARRRETGFVATECEA